MKEILITKERNNEKFQEFRKMILENLAIVLKIICGDKFLIHKFDTNDYMDYEPKFVTKEEYAMNMVERDLHEVYNIMTQGYTEVCNGGSIEKIDLTHKYNMCTLVSTETKTKNNTQEIKMKDGKKEMKKIRLTKKELMAQVKIMRNDLINGWIDGAVDNCGSYKRVNETTTSYWGIEKEVCDYMIEFKNCTVLKTPAFKEKVARYLENDFEIKGVRLVVGGMFGTAEVLVDVEDVETGKLVEVCYLWDNNCNYSLHRELEKQYPNAEKEFKEKEELERLRASLEEKKDELLEKELTFSIDGEGTVEEVINVSYKDANDNYKRRLRVAPNPEDGYNKTYIRVMIDGKLLHKLQIGLKNDCIYSDLKETILANVEVLRDTWVNGEGVSWLSPKKNQEHIEKQYGSKEKLSLKLDVVKMVVENIDTTPVEEKKELTEFEHIAEGIGAVVVEKRIEKMEEKQMNTINKNALTNRMTKLGEFLKENRDKDAVENKVLELFPKAMEVEVFEGDNVVHFLVGQEYVGKAPTKKEMKELDWEYRETIQTYGLTLYVAVESDKIKMDAHIAVDYRDRHGCPYNIDFTVKELEIELELTMEVAKELAEEIKNKHSNGDICQYPFHEKVECSPEPEETDELEKNIKDHINSVLDLMVNIEKEKFEYMYKKTVAVKRNDRYELTSSLEDIWTGLTVYVGDSSNMLMIPNSEKSFLTDIVEDFLCSNIGINETVEKIKEKIKRKFEYSYSKSVTVKEEEQIYVLETPSGVELFWYYKDAYSRMVELVNEMSERFSNNYEVIIEDCSARMETFSWRIIEKNIK